MELLLLHSVANTSGVFHVGDVAGCGQFIAWSCYAVIPWSSPGQYATVHRAVHVHKQYTYTYTHTFNGTLSRTIWVRQYQKGKTNLDFTEARDSEWQWHQLGHMQVCNLLQTDNHASTSPLSFLQAWCPSRHLTNSVKALKASALNM